MSEERYILMPHGRQIRCKDCERLIQYDRDYYIRKSDKAPICIKCMPPEELRMMQEKREK